MSLWRIRNFIAGVSRLIATRAHCLGKADSRTSFENTICAHLLTLHGKTERGGDFLLTRSLPALDGAQASA
eukprot:6202984-Pleurochrysis_carterae.AAC.1